MITPNPNGGCLHCILFSGNQLNPLLGTVDSFMSAFSHYSCVHNTRITESVLIQHVLQAVHFPKLGIDISALSQCNRHFVS